jgi:small-conductance mechanosensitive channel
VNDAIITALITASGAVLAGFLKLTHWAVKEWASVRREATKAEAEAAAQQRAHNDRLLELQREDNAEMREALLEQARSNTALLAKLDVIADGLEALRADRDEARARRSANGSRSPLGEH